MFYMWYTHYLTLWQHHSHDDIFQPVGNSAEWIAIILFILLIAAHHIRLALASEAWRHLGGQDSMRTSLLACQASIGDLGAWGGLLCYHRFVVCSVTLDLTNKQTNDLHEQIQITSLMDGPDIFSARDICLFPDWRCSFPINNSLNASVAWHLTCLTNPE